MSTPRPLARGVSLALATLALTLGVGLAGTIPSAVAQPPSASASPSATPSTTASATPSTAASAPPSAAPSALPSALPSASPSAAPSAAPGALPEPHGAHGLGERPTRPARAPQLGPDGKPMKGQSRMRPTSFGVMLYEPPPDGAIADPSLPVGTLVVEVRDADDAPVPNAKLTLVDVRSSVSKGDSESRTHGDTDAQGTVRFDGLRVGSEHRHRAEVTLGKARFVAMTTLDDQQGKRLRLHVYEPTSELGELPFAVQAQVFLSFKDDVIQVEHVFELGNASPYAWTPTGVRLRLPPGLKALTVHEESELARFEKVGDEVELVGTVRPGRHQASFGYQLPRTGEVASFEVQMPPRTAVAQIRSEASATMSLSANDFPAAERTKARNGQRILETARQVTQQEQELGGIQTLQIRLAGMPPRPRGPWVAMSLALSAVALGFLFVRTRKKGEDPEALTHEKQDLEAARDALLDELASLERMLVAGEVGPKSYERLRLGLLDALARLLERLDAVDAKLAPPRGAKASPRSSRRGARARAEDEEDDET